MMDKLPIVRRKREADKTTQLMKKFRGNIAWEIKQTKTNTLPANSLKPHQRDKLLQVRHGIFSFKIPDYGRQNPFDGFTFFLAEAIVVVIYGDNTIISIDIDKFPPIDTPLTKEKALLLGKII